MTKKEKDLRKGLGRLLADGCVQKVVTFKGVHNATPVLEDSFGKNSTQVIIAIQLGKRAESARKQ